MNTQQKQFWIDTMTAHRDADRLIQGDWIDDQGKDGLYRGCFFGCAMQTDDSPMEQAATAMGLPHWLIQLAEAIFEGVRHDQAADFPVQFLNAIPVDVDLDAVKHKIAAKRMERLIELCKDCKKSIFLNTLKSVRDHHLDPKEENLRSIRSEVHAVERLAMKLKKQGYVWYAIRSALYSLGPSDDSTRESAARAVDLAVELEEWEEGWLADVQAWGNERDALLAALGETE